MLYDVYFVAGSAGVAGAVSVGAVSVVAAGVVAAGVAAAGAAVFGAGASVVASSIILELLSFSVPVKLKLDNKIRTIRIVPKAHVLLSKKSVVF